MKIKKGNRQSEFVLDILNFGHHSYDVICFRYFLFLDGFSRDVRAKGACAYKKVSPGNYIFLSAVIVRK